LYGACLENGSAFPGLRPHVARVCHTTEQKLFGMGRLVDAILFPFWKDTSCFDALLQSAEALSECKLFGGGLVFSHTYEYLILLIGDAEMATQALAEGPVKAGPNGAAFLRVVNATGEREKQPNEYTWARVAKEVRKHLPTDICFNVFNCQANACKLVLGLRCRVSACDAVSRLAMPCLGLRFRVSACDAAQHL
jgi:hypothetical protein